MSTHSSRWWNNKTKTMSLFSLVFVACLDCAISADDVFSSGRKGSYRVAEIEATAKGQSPQRMKGKYPMMSGEGKEIKGILFLANNSADAKINHTGCGKYTNNRFPTSKWLSLVKRGDCSLHNKIKMATKVHNASGIIIYDNKDNTQDEAIIHELPKSLKDKIAITISAVDGKKLLHMLQSSSKYGVHVRIIPGEEKMIDNTENNISKTSVLFVSISFVVLMIISLAWLVFYYIQRFRYSHAKERLAKRLAAAAKKALTKIPQRVIKSDDKVLEGEHDQCAVCIEQYKLHDVIRTLPCDHMFHKSCVDPWLLENRSCPMCKMDILVAYGMQVGTSQESVHQTTEPGPMEQLIMEESDTGYAIEEAQNEADLPLICLHNNTESTEDNNRTSSAAHNLGSKEEVYSSAVSLHSHNSVSLVTTRVEKRDIKDSDNTERKSLLQEESDYSKQEVSKCNSEEIADTNGDTVLLIAEEDISGQNSSTKEGEASDSGSCCRLKEASIIVVESGGDSVGAVEFHQEQDLSPVSNTEA